MAGKVGHSQRRRWRDYETAAGKRRVKKFLDGLSDEDAAAVAAAMKEVRAKGLKVARHLDGDIYEARADGDRVIYRVLFAPEGAKQQVLLALKKKTQRRRHDSTGQAAAERLARPREEVGAPSVTSTARALGYLTCDIALPI